MHIYSFTHKQIWKLDNSQNISKETDLILIKSTWGNIKEDRLKISSTLSLDACCYACESVGAV